MSAHLVRLHQLFQCHHSFSLSDVINNKKALVMPGHKISKRFIVLPSWDFVANVNIREEDSDVDCAVLSTSLKKPEAQKV